MTLVAARELVDGYRELTPLDRCEIRLACEAARRQWWAQRWGNMFDSWPPAHAAQDAFEAWLIEKWLRQIRSPAFRASVQGQQLIAEWERG